MRSQQLMWQGRAEDLPVSSKQQPRSIAYRKPAGIEPGIAVLALAVLSFSLVLAYAASSAVITRNGYAEINLRQEIEDLRAETGLLRYQIHLAESNARVQETAARLGMVPGDPVTEVDYVHLPHSDSANRREFAATKAGEGDAGLASVLAELASGVARAGGRAEASTVEGHRQ